MEDKIK
jgi:hypothetical protein